MVNPGSVSRAQLPSATHKPRMLQDAVNGSCNVRIYYLDQLGVNISTANSLADSHASSREIYPSWADACKLSLCMDVGYVVSLDDWYGI